MVLAECFIGALKCNTNTHIVCAYIVKRMIVLIISLILILLVSAIGAYAFSNFKSDTLEREAFLQCLVGYCATSLTTGVKRCPAKNDRIIYDPQNEVCNPVGLCTAPQTPNAELGDGSTNSVGQCDTITTPCRCLPFPKCQGYVSNHFEYSVVSESNITDVVATNINIVEGNVGARNVGDTTDAFSCSIPGASLANVITASNCAGLTTVDDYNKCVRTNACPNGVMSVIVEGPVELEAFKMTGNIWNIANISCVKGFNTNDLGVLLRTECSKPLPSQTWWDRHCSPSTFPTDQEWQNYLSGASQSWSSQCLTDIQNEWIPIYDKSTDIIYCKNA